MPHGVGYGHGRRRKRAAQKTIAKSTMSYMKRGGRRTKRKASLLKRVGGAVKKGGKFLYKHRAKIAAGAKVAAKVAPLLL